MSLPSPPHPASISPEQLLAQCNMEFVRRSGPGGQHRNKVSTAVVIEHRPSGIRAEANERRSQAENRTIAILRLRVNLAIGLRTSWTAGDSPSLLWRSRCRGGRIEVSPTHDDFPAVLAEALDAIAANSFEPKTAANQLGCTVSQLLKLLKNEPRAFAQLNQERQSAGRHPLQ